MQTPFEIRLHIGAHKTATTHLQNALDANKRRILESGCIYLSRSFFRRSGLLKAVHLNHWGKPNAVGRLQSFDQFLTVPASYPRRILVSEEDILGMSIDMLQGIYPDAARQLTPWSALSERGSRHVFLCVRDYATVLPSAYSQALRDGHAPLPFSEYRSLWMDARPSWINLIAAIVEQFGAARVTVWTMEHYLKNKRQIIHALTGSDLPEVQNGVPETTRRLSADTVRKIERLDPSLDRPARRKQIQELVRSGQGEGPYDPLSGAEKAFLSGCYRKDIERIGRMGVTFLG